MSTPDSTRELVSTFIAARQDPDADAARLMDSSFTFESPLLRFDDRQTYLDSHRAFQSHVRGMTLITELYGPDEAILLYDLDTATPAGVQRTAEYFRCASGRVTGIQVLFDSAPWLPIFPHPRLAEER